jgi:hypothetical protein
MAKKTHEKYCPRKGIIDEKITKFLWNSKLKSRDCNLTILEFMNLNKAQFRPFLTMIKQYGDLYYDRFV